MYQNQYHAGINPKSNLQEPFPKMVAENDLDPTISIRLRQFLRPPCLGNILATGFLPFNVALPRWFGLRLRTGIITNMTVTSLEAFDAQQYTILNWSMWTIAFLITVVRLAVRYLHLNRLFWDDAFAILGLVSLTGMAILNQTSRDAIYLIEILAVGGIPPPPFTSTEKISEAMIAQAKMQFAFMMLFWTTLWSVKASLLMFYRRLFVGLYGYMRWWWVVVGFCVATYLASLLSNVMNCMPISRRFKIGAEATCKLSHGINAIWVATAIDIASDILLAVLPIRLLIGLRIPLKQKIGVGAIFLLGMVIIIFAVLRMVKILESLHTLNPNGSVSIALWSMLETGVAIIVGSLPTMKALITRRKDDTSYASGINKRSRSNGTNLAANSSNVTKGPHIRLYDMQSGEVKSTINGGYDSDEALNGGIKNTQGGITQTRVISVSSHPGDISRSTESFNHAV